MNCKEATFLISKEQETKLTFKEKLMLKLHLTACKLCSLFEKETTFLCDNIDYMHKNNSSELKMDATTKKAIVENIKKQCNCNK